MKKISKMLTLLIVSIVIANWVSCTKDTVSPVSDEASIKLSGISSITNTTNEEVPIEISGGSISSTVVIGLGITSTLVRGSGDTDNSRFTFNNNGKLALISPKYDGTSHYSIRLNLIIGSSVVEGTVIIPIPQLTSTAFVNGGALPQQYGGDAGAGTAPNPPLKIDKIPAGTQSILITLIDLDYSVNLRPACHWLVYNIPTNKLTIVQNESWTGSTVQVYNADYGPIYQGPWPPRNAVHNYQFIAYFLNTSTLAVSYNFRDVNGGVDIESKLGSTIISKAVLNAQYTGI